MSTEGSGAPGTFARSLAAVIAEHCDQARAELKELTERHQAQTQRFLSWVDDLQAKLKESEAERDKLQVQTQATVAALVGTRPYEWQPTKLFISFEDAPKPPDASTQEELVSLAEVCDEMVVDLSGAGVLHPRWLRFFADLVAQEAELECMVRVSMGKHVLVAQGLGIEFPARNLLAGWA